MPIYKIKIIVVGDFSVGKTTLINNFIEEKFSEDYVPTLGVQFTSKLFNINGNDVQLVLWDIAGQDSSAVFRSKFYENTEGFVIVFDLTRKSTLENVKNWYAEVTNFVGEIPCLLIGNKLDLKEKREVTNEDIIKMLLENDLNVKIRFETSARTGENVNEGFLSLIKLLIEKYQK